MKPHTSPSKISRPYTVTVDGDIPQGSEIRVKVWGTWPIGPDWEKVYSNPYRSELITPQIKTFTFSLHTANNSLALPFLYAIIIEGDNAKRTYTAEMFADAGKLRKREMMYMAPEGERAFITQAFSKSLRIPLHKVTRAETGRPWILEIDGSAPGQSRIELDLIGLEPDGTKWEHKCVVQDEEETYTIVREELRSTTFRYGGCGLQLAPSPSGNNTPFLEGVIFEGDGRRLFLSVSDLVGDEVHENLQLIKANNTGSSCLIIKPTYPAHFGFPSAMTRITEMVHEGKLRPAWMSDLLNIDVLGEGE